MSANRPPGAPSGAASSLTKSGKQKFQERGNGSKGKFQFARGLTLTRDNALNLLADLRFDVAIGIVIVLNAITIGIEQSLFINNQSTLVVRIVETVFLLIYMAELGLRFSVYGRACMQDIWVKLDMVLILLGLITWVLENGVGNAPEEMGALMLLRMARLMRLAKTARLVAQVPECKMLVRGLLGSSSLIMYTLMLLLVVVYCFSVLGVELITKHSLSMGDNPDPVFRKIVEEFYASVPGTMLTLLRFATMDHISEVYKPLVEVEPWLTVYFLSLVFIVTIMTMNLVTSVIFTNMLTANQREVDGNLHDQERDWGSLISNLKNMFNRIDEDNSGQLSLDEFLEVDKEDQEALCQALEVGNAAEIFRMLDTEKRGEVSINEFFDCILEKVLASGDADLKRMERQIETMHWRLKETFSSQNDITVQMKSVQAQLREILKKIDPDSDAEPMMGGKRPSSASLSTTRAALEVRLKASKLRQTSLDQPVQPRASLGASDAVLQAWEEDISIKLKAILDDGMRVALDSLRSADNKELGSQMGSPRDRSPRGRSLSAESQQPRPAGARQAFPSIASFSEAMDPQAPSAPKPRGPVKSIRSSRVISSPEQAGPKLDVLAPVIGSVK